MTNLSTKLTAFFIFSILTFALVGANELNWPVQGNVDIYHGFGEFRSNRFHAGLDIRTGGRPGRKIFSPVDGYVYRIKMAYNGYGKGLYLKGDDGLIYVFGHLQGFQAKIDSVVKKIQIAKQRYYFDKYFPKDSIRVKTGQLIALSGQTGAGAPHIHFETRVTENIPINPLLAGFVLKDHIKPTLKRVGFQYVDATSLFPDGQRSKFLPLIKPKNKDYKIESIPYFSKPFGFLIDGFDQSKYNGIKQAIYSLQLQIDGKDYYEIIFDSLNFETGRSVNFNYDTSEVNQGRKRVRRLFKMTGNDYFGINCDDNQAVFSFDTTLHKISTHEAIITASDVYGNAAVSKIEFITGPSRIFRLDSTVNMATDTNFYYFRAPENYENLLIDSVVPNLNVQSQWGRFGKAAIFPMENGDLRMETYKGTSEYATVRLRLYTKRGVIDDKLIIGRTTSNPKRVKISWDIVDQGIAVHVATNNLRTSSLYLRLFNNEKLLGLLPPAEITSMREYHFFIPATNKYEQITQMEITTNPEQEVIGQTDQNVIFHLVGQKSKEIISPDNKFRIMIEPNTTYSLNFIALEELEAQGFPKNLRSTIYTIKPDYFFTKKNFMVEVAIDSSARWQKRTGLCWFDEKDSKWVWLNNNNIESSVIRSKSQGGGKFAAVVDRKKPKIINLNIRRGMLIRSSQPPIRFEIIDSLSGIRDDRDISIYIDDQWLIPEYDPETGVCISKPWFPLDDGDHELRVELTDRAGNVSRQKVKFKVQTNAQK